MGNTLQADLMAVEDSGLELAVPDDDVRGMVVLYAHDQRIGEVDDLVVDLPERRARLLVVASGGVLGLGARWHLVPVEAVARVSEHVRLHHVADHVLAAKEHDPSLVVIDDVTPVYDHYGATPFWRAAHRVTYFHDRRW